MLGLRTLLVAVALVFDCTSAKDEAKPKPKVDTLAATTDVDPRFVGKWKLEKYNVSCEISIVDGKPVITAEDYADSEAFQVTKIRWEDPELKASFRMPSTNHITHSTFTIIERSTMRDVYDGAATGDDRWTKEAGARAPTGAGAPTSKIAATATAKTAPVDKGATATPPPAE